MDLASHFAEPLADLGALDPAFAGIMAPMSAAGAAKTGVTAQFLEEAAEYHRRYLDTSYWAKQLDEAFATAGGVAPPRTIIDIGSGSGNSVLPLADRFPHAQIVATDISPQLLAILRDGLRRRPEGADRFGLVCVDAATARYRPGVADLAVGAAILHHIRDPAQVLAACREALRPGGLALFFEPFEAGNAILKLTYQRILERANDLERSGKGMRFVARMVEDYVVRSRPPTDPVFERIDDKWMFTHTYFQRIGREQGWADVTTYGLNIDATPLRKQAIVQMRLAAELPPSALPDWAWTIIDETDAGLSMDLKREWATEGAVLLRKAG